MTTAALSRTSCSGHHFALDAGTFSPGVQGEEFTGGGTKIAASIGLNMFSGMTDTLTERESLGNSFNGVQAKPSMKNALLQGMSKASQDQAGRTASSIDQERSYVVVPEGKEMISVMTLATVMPKITPITPPASDMVADSMRN